MKRKQQQINVRYVAFVAASVDGKISLTNRISPSWTSNEDWKFFQKSLKSFDAFVVGRNTYLSEAKRLRKRNTFVITSRPKSIVRLGKVTFVNPSKANLARLFKDYKKVAVLGGGAIYNLMLREGLLNEIFVTIEPLIFGRGKDMFVGGSGITRVRLLSIKKLNSEGTILLHYEIKSQKNDN